MATRTLTVPARNRPAITERLDGINRRIDRYNLDGHATATYGTPRIVQTHDEHGRDIDVEVVDVTLTYDPVVVAGEWTLAAAVDFTAADTPMVFTFDDEVPVNLDATVCDHCQTARRRNTAYVVRAADGRTAQVGSTCVRDFLGIDPARFLHVVEIAREFDDEDFTGSGGRWEEFGLVEFVTYARAAIRTFGWAAASQWEQVPTRDLTVNALVGSRTEETREIRDAINDEVRAFTAAAIEWGATFNATSEFDRNLQAVARSEMIGRRGWGLAAYLPVAYQRHLEAEAEAREETPAVPVPEGRMEVTGTVVSLREGQNDWGFTYRMTVVDDRGFRVNSTVPRAIDPVIGDRVRFTATLSRSDRDETFGFGGRPARAEIVQRYDEEVGAAA